MKHLITILLFISTLNLSAQFTSIPDANFEQALINLGLDTGTPDGIVLTANIDTVENLDVSFSNISNLTGIEDFSALQVLDCNYNYLPSLDVSQNSSLTDLWCGDNQFTSLDVSQNLLLSILHCGSNQLSILNVSQNLELRTLDCGANLLTSLDIYQNAKLEALYCSQNLLTWLNVSANDSLKAVYCAYNSLSCLNLKNGNNNNLLTLFVHDNSNLTCIEVDSVLYSTTNWIPGAFYFDPQHTFSTNCPNPCLVGIEELPSSTVNIYPNPTSGQIIIPLEEGTIKSVTLRNSLGQLLLTDNHPSSDKLELDISTFPTGIYFLQLELDGEVLTKKIIKQ